MAKRGGKLNVVVSADFGSIEPALISNQDGLQLMNATQLGLVAYRDTGVGAGRRLIPYGAAHLPTISRDGTTYVFRIRHGLRFSDGTRVSANNFAAGFERVLDPRMQASRAFAFADVKGARALMTGRAAHLSGVVARKNRLVVRLVRPAPDFLERLALPVVTAIPLNLPVVPGGVRAPLPSAGPYYVKEYVRGRLARLVRNRYWDPATLPSRPANFDEIDYSGRTPEEAATAVSNGDGDVATFLGSGVLPPGLIREYVRRYGVNRSRFFVRPRLGRGEVIFNVRGPLFRKNARLRRAINFALDRTELVRAHGPLAGSPTDQLLLPRRSGFRDWKLYPAKPNLAAARRLARGAVRGGVVSLFAPETPWGLAAASVIRSNLARLRLRVRIETFATSVFVSRLVYPDEPWDLAVWVWGSLRADPVAYINYPLAKQYIKSPPPYGFNWGSFDEPEWNARMQRAARVRTGRANSYALLDRDLMRRSAPMAPYLAENALTIVSARVGCFSSLNTGWPNLAALCLR